MNAGLDIGNITSIACAESTEMIESRIQPTEKADNLENSHNIFDFNGSLFTVEKGDFENNIYKYKKANFAKLLYYTLSKSTDDCINNVVFSMPAKQFLDDSKVLEFYNKIVANRIHTINGKTMIINKIDIVPEGYALKVLGYLTDEDNEDLMEGVETLVIDMGGETTDLIFFDENYVFRNAHSVKYGLLKIYDRTRQYVESKQDMELTKVDGKLYFNGDKNIRYNREERQKITDPNAYKKEFVLDAIREILNEVLGKFPNIKQYNIILCGGGGPIIYPLFKQLYPHAVLVDEIDINARGNKIIADAKWKGENEKIELVIEVVELLAELWENRTEENEQIFMNLWNNAQGQEILKDLLKINNEKDIKNNFNVKQYLEEKLNGI